MFTLFPSTCLQYYGPTSQGSNYGLLFTSFGLAGFIGPYVGGKLKDITKSYYVPFIVGAVVVAVAVLMISFVKGTGKENRLIFKVIKLKREGSQISFFLFLCQESLYHKNGVIFEI